ncbi:MAG TPA: hypothetical protein ENJ50_00900 [Planctomycetaceae bacterium]|nr:hypothetical protein [Planctomycetaceae bacterium]
MNNPMNALLGAKLRSFSLAGNGKDTDLRLITDDPEMLLEAEVGHAWLNIDLDGPFRVRVTGPDDATLKFEFEPREETFVTAAELDCEVDASTQRDGTPHLEAVMMVSRGRFAFRSSTERST